MKIRTDFVTNSSSSSFTSIHIENPILAKILAMGRNEFENAGFDFLEDKSGEVIGIEYEETECGLSISEYKSLESLAEDFIGDVGWDVFDCDDPYHEICDEIKTKRKEISEAYKKVEISFGDSGWDGDGGDPVCDAIQKVVDRWGFRKIGRKDPDFKNEVKKWKLILTYEGSTPGCIIDIDTSLIEDAISSGEPYAMARMWHSGYEYSFENGKEKFSRDEPWHDKKGFEEYQQLTKSAPELTEHLVQKAILSENLEIEGTAYAGRIERIEHIHVDDRVILKANYDDPYYSPVAVEVFNENGETLGYLTQSDGFSERISLEELAVIIDLLEAHVSKVTPLSQRRRNAKYALMSLRLCKKGTWQEKNAQYYRDLIANTEFAKKHFNKLKDRGAFGITIEYNAIYHPSDISAQLFSKLKAGDSVLIKADVDERKEGHEMLLLQIYNSEGLLVGCINDGQDQEDDTLFFLGAGSKFVLREIKLPKGNSKGKVMFTLPGYEECEYYTE